MEVMFRTILIFHIAQKFLVVHVAVDVISKASKILKQMYSWGKSDNLTFTLVTLSEQVTDHYKNTSVMIKLCK